MNTKKDVLEAALKGEGCLGKAKDDEPVFVLVGDDALAAGTIGFWLTRLQMIPGHNPTKAAQARHDIEQFQLWATKHGTKTPD